MRSASRRLILVASAVVLGACGSDGPNLGPANLSLIGDPVSVTRLRSEPYSLTYYSGLRSPARFVIRDAATWRLTWSMIWRNVSPEPALPHIDFAREMVVVAALGERPTGGYGILVEAAAINSTRLTIQIRTTRPGASCGTTQALTQPVDVARVPRVSVPVRFIERETVTDCD